jgi:Secretion system C-terminal sorting domain/Copper type II ascorbate-dependent monooxygenase, C-terminal domain
MKKIYSIFLLAGMYYSPQVEAQTDYNNVANIFYTHCTKCHHDGGGAPFSLMNYSDASSMSSSIQDALGSGIMPPWHADTAYTTSGHKVPHMLNENTLTLVEKNAILQWITDLATEGDPSLAPKPPTYGDMSFKLNGKPDMVLHIPTFHSNASPTLTNPYNCFVIPTNLTQDRWLRAFEVVPGNLKAVHHVVVSVDSTSSRATDTSGNCASQGGQFGVGGWTPGTPPVVFPSQAPFKTGIRIPKGSSFILQLHYAPGSDGLIDSTSIRLFFYAENETGIRNMSANTLLQDWGAFLPGFGTTAMPAGQIKTYKATSATSPLVTHPVQPTGDFTVFSVSPHSHKVCTKIKNYAYKGTDTIPLINIPNWDFKWEGNYFFPKPVKIPAGYTLESEHVYDNTTANKHLVGPPVNTTWGQATSDEMLFDAFLYLDYQAGDENIDLKAMIENDTLMQVGIKKFDVPSIQSYIYPNPASDNLSIYVSKTSVYKGRIFNITGQTIINTETFNDKITVDVKNIPSGLYVIEITDTKTNDRITKKIIISN